MRELIVYLQALSIYCKDAHYGFTGVNFKSLHEWMDEINEPLADFIDEIKESYILRHGEKVPRGTVINAEAVQYVPNDLSSNESILRAMNALLSMVNTHIGNIADATRGDDDLLGRIGAHLQKHLGLLNLALTKENNNDID